MILKTFVGAPIDNNNYLIIDEQTKKAALIDCSNPNDEAKKVIKEYGATLEYILLTHGHFDHIAGIRPEILNDGEGVKVLMHKGDIDWVENVNLYMPMMGMPEMTVPKIDKYIEDGEVIQLGETQIKVIHTPGHTQGGVCYLADNKLFSGDTIFKESVGRCDLPGGDFAQIVESIKNRVFTLPEETEIYPGHGKTTTVGWEKLHNFFA